MHDVVVCEQLRNRGMLSLPYSVLLPYEAMERRARILDKPPKQIALLKAGEISPCGTAQKFVMVYNQLMHANTVDVGIIDILGKVTYCDVSVFYTLQTLIRLSIGKSIDMVTAASNIFRTIITHQCETLTEQVMYTILNKYVPVNFYASELVNGIHIAVYKEDELALLWRTNCEFSGYYMEAIEPGMKVIKEKCHDVKELRAFIMDNYKAAKEDKDFMYRLYKPGANRWLTAMLYYLYPTMPDLIDSFFGAELNLIPRSVADAMTVRYDQTEEAEECE